ncbi:MAG TPA: cupredoxin domain-containing protein [Reyranella sp.]|jgi:cytochrome c oxidase subunit 2|nr:cupredoxin domain-containing protein [Reyranella sp.]
MKRRAFTALLLGSAAGGSMAGGWRLWAAEPAGVEVSIAASKFEFQPDTVKAKVGQPLTFVLTSLDRIHGFKMPEFGIRTDIIPDQETRVTITPQKPGQYAFFCDVFCGDGHEEMGGTLIVEA